MSAIEELASIATALKKDLESNGETQAVLLKVVAVLENCLACPDVLSEKKVQAYFYDDFSANIIQDLSKAAYLANQDYRNTVRRLLQLYMQLLLRELPRGNRGLLLSLRPLFDPELPLYRGAFADLKSALASTFQPQTDKKWRESLQKGTRIDAIKEERIDIDRVEGWAVAVVKEVSDSSPTIRCEFLGMRNSPSNSFVYTKDSTRIAPLGSRTEGWEWRDRIKENDRIDIFDTMGHWFLGTVLKTHKIKDAAGIEVPEVYVGYRIYSEDGTKLDNQNRRHEGWSERYDEWIPAYSIRLQRFCFMQSYCVDRPNSITKLGTVYCRWALDSDPLACDDSPDILFNDGKISLVHRPGASYSSLYIELMNDFGTAGGFQSILDRMQEVKDPTALGADLIFLYIDIMAAPHHLYHRAHIIGTVGPFTERVIQYMSNIPNEHLRSVKREKLELALSQIDFLMRRVYTPKTKGEQAIRMKVGIALSLLRSEVLEHRIQAVRIIAETCKTAKASQMASYNSNLPSTNDSLVLSGLLQVPRVIEEVFGKRSHIQLIQRSTEILKFFLLNSNITSADLNVIWDCCEHDEQSKVEVFKVISDSAGFLSSELIGRILEKYTRGHRPAFRDQDALLIRELGGKLARPVPAVRNIALELMWKVICGEVTGVSPEVWAKLFDSFCDLITSPSVVAESIMKEYFGQAYSMLEKGTNATVALRVLRKSLVQLPLMRQYTAQEQMITALLNGGSAIPLFFMDLERYCNNASRLAGEGKLNPAQHREELEERREFLIFGLCFSDNCTVALQWSYYKLTKENTQLLWTRLVEQCAVSEDQTIFYKFLKDLTSLGQLEMHVSSIQDLSEFFSGTLCNDKNSFQQLIVEGMEAVESLLVAVNRAKGYISEPVARKPVPMQIGPQLPQADVGDSEDGDFKVLALPTKLSGVSVLWKIMLEARNETVSMKAIELLNKLYTKLGEKLEPSVAEISGQFIETAIEKLRIFYDRMTRDGENRGREIVKLLKLIDEMLDESERKGNAGIIPLQALLKGAPARVTFLNHATFDPVSNPGCLDRVDIQLHSHVTLWQTKLLISEAFRILPEMIRITTTQGDCSDRDNGKTLEQIRIKDGDAVRVMLRAEELSPKGVLTSPEKKMSDKAVAVLTEVFNKFAKEGKIAKGRFVDIARVCMRDSDQAKIEGTVKSIFDYHDIGAKGYLSLEEFLNYYSNMLPSGEATIWGNLKSLGYNNELRHFDQPAKSASPRQKSYITLPRYILSNNAKCFDFLFQLFKLGGEIATTVTHLAFRLAVSEDCLRKVLTCFASPVDWTRLFCSGTAHESAYMLFVASAILGDMSEPHLLSVRAEAFGEERRAWKELFFIRGGLGWAISSLKSMKGRMREDGAGAYVKALLRLISIYVLGSMQANDRLPRGLCQYPAQGQSDDSETELSPNSQAAPSTPAPQPGTTIALPGLADETLAVYRDLCSILRGKLGEEVLASTNLLELAYQLLLILEELLQPDTHYEQNAYTVARRACRLYEGIIICDPEIYIKLSGVYSTSKLMLSGVLCPQSRILRGIFQRLIFFLFANVFPRGVSMAQTPLGEFVSSMLDISSIIAGGSDCTELCDLLLLMVDSYSGMLRSGKGESVVNLDEKLLQFLKHLSAYVSKENVKTPGEPDKTLLGLMRVAGKLVVCSVNSQVVTDPREAAGLMEEVFFGWLFPMRSPPSDMYSFKCKSNRSREAAYALILSVLARCPQAALPLLKNCLTPLALQLTELAGWNCVPDRQERSGLGFAGMKNLGYICYLNATMQQFFMIAPFRNAILSVDDGKPREPSPDSGVDDNVLHQLQSLFGYMLSSVRKDANPASFCFSFKDLEGKPLSTAVQQDSHEFLNLFMDRMERVLKPTPYRSLMQSIFGGKSCSQVVCSACGFVSSTYEDYCSLSLEIKNQKTMAEALDRFIAGGEVSDYFCQECQKKRDVVKRTLLSTLPNALIVHLQRFTFNFDTLMNEKIHSRLEFPKTLDMRPYTVEGAAELAKSQGESAAGESQRRLSEIHEKELKRERKASGPKIIREPKKEDPAAALKKDPQYYMYKLMGIVVHSGNAGAGHYYSFINVDRNEWEVSENGMKTEKERWLEFNDSVISEFDFARVETECFGGAQDELGAACYMEEIGDAAVQGRSKSAYMLVYERKQKSLIPEFIPAADVQAQDVVVSSLECDGTAISRAEKTHGRVVMWTPQGEACVLHRFHDIHTPVPKRIAEYLYERLVYSGEFVTFIENAFCQMCAATQTAGTKSGEELRMTLCQLGDRMFVDLLPHFALPNTPALADLCTAVCQLFSSSVDASKSVLGKFVREPMRAFGLLVLCPEVSVRQYVQKLLLASFITTISFETEIFDKLVQEGPNVTHYAAVSRQFVELLVSFIGYELAANWTKFRQYFELLRDIVLSGGHPLVTYCFAKDLPALLLDFFLEKRSPQYSPKIKRYEMGNLAQMPDLSPLMELVSFLLRKAVFPRKSIGGEWNNALLSPLALGEESFVPSAPTVRCIMIPDLIFKHVHCGGKIEQIVPFILHLCYENKLRSLETCNAMLQAMNNNGAASMDYFLDLVADLLALGDSYQPLRMEWILGCPHPITHTAFGLAHIRSMGEDVNYLISPLVMWNNVYPLMNQMWMYRLKQRTLVTHCIRMVLRLANSVPAVYEYVKQIPSPNYCFARYTDWFQPFLDSKCLVPTATAADKEVLDECHRLLFSYNKLIESEHCPPPQDYLVGNTVRSVELKDRERSIRDVRLRVAEVLTEVYPSVPFGEGNSSLDSAYLVAYPRFVLYQDRHFGHAQPDGLPKLAEAIAKGNPVSGPKAEKKQKPSAGEEQVGGKLRVVPTMLKVELVQGTFFAQRNPDLGPTFNGSIKVQVRPGKGARPNFYCPRSKFAVRLPPNTKETTLFWLQKTHAEKDWGDFEVTLSLKDPPGGAPEPKPAQIGQQKPEAAPGGQPVAVAVPHPSPHQDEPTEVPVDGANASPNLGGTEAEIACPKCTFLNRADATVCDVCLEPLKLEHMQH